MRSTERRSRWCRASSRHPMGMPPLCLYVLRRKCAVAAAAQALSYSSGPLSWSHWWDTERVASHSPVVGADSSSPLWEIIFLPSPIVAKLATREDCLATREDCSILKILGIPEQKFSAEIWTLHSYHRCERQHRDHHAQADGMPLPHGGGGGPSGNRGAAGRRLRRPLGSRRRLRPQASRYIPGSSP